METNCIIVKPKPKEEVTASGIIISQPKPKRYGEGVVVKAPSESELSVGDEVYYENPYYVKHTEIEYNGDMCHLINLENIMLVCR